MAINKKLIHFKTKENFNKEVANGNILDNSICFILDVKEIYTHGTIYNNDKFSISTGVPTSNNNANTYGYYGTLKNLGIEGDSIYINNITVYKRLGNAPNHTVPMWCRILLVKDNQHILYAQSSTSKRWEDIAAELPITFDMCVKDQTLSANDTILIVFTSDPTSSIDSFILVGVRTFSKSGAIISIDSANVNYNTGYAPALKIDYLPLYTSVVHNTGNETISGEKTFLNTLITKNININNETVITSEIDPGELKVLHNGSSKGFIVRTVNSDKSVLDLELLSTNGLTFNKYTFPQTSGQVILDSTLIINITYSKLLILKNTNNLIKGLKYRITDYITTTTQPDTISAGNLFDLIVEAIDNNKLSENAKACLNSSTNYFNNCRVEAWDIKYCIDNDNSKFAWADITNGKGVIYYMKDEWDNECWYDFKNIKFLRSDEWFANHAKFSEMFPTLIQSSIGGEDNYFYTFSRILTDIPGDPYDATIFYPDLFTKCSHTNKIEKYISSKIHTLNNTILVTNNEYEPHSNFIGINNCNNTFAINGSHVTNNTIEGNCLNNLVFGNFSNNIIGKTFLNNSINGLFLFNHTGTKCTSLSINSNFNYNNLKDNLWHLVFDYPVSYCEFGSYMLYNYFHNGDDYPSSEVGLSYCKFGDGLTGALLVPSMHNVEFETKCYYNDSSNFHFNTLSDVNGELIIEKLIVPHELRLYVYRSLGTQVNDATSPAKFDIRKEVNVVNSFTWSILRDLSEEYFTIEALENGLQAQLSVKACEYSLDGNTWNSLSAATNTPTVNAGKKIYFRGNLTPNSNNGIGTFTISKKCNVKGNIMSLLYGDDFIEKTNFSGKNYAFLKLFKNCTRLVDASGLILPAITLTNYCYYYMFAGCTSLTSAPELPATTLANYCYGNMYESCTSLTSAPELPATTLAQSCYQAMFRDCTSLTSAPVLPATTLAKTCYSQMFNRCSSLNNITMLATDISASYCLDSWVNGVASTGTFTKDPYMNSLSIGTSGIPSGWTIDSDTPVHEGGSDEGGSDE